MNQKGMVSAEKSAYFPNPHTTSAKMPPQDVKYELDPAPCPKAEAMSHHLDYPLMTRPGGITLHNFGCVEAL